jgi:germination protein M
MAKRKVSRWLFGLLAAAIIVGLIAYVYFSVYCDRCPLIRIYFLKGDSLAAVDRILRPDEAPMRKAVEELLAGPKINEQTRGYISLIPSDVSLLDYRLENGVAILNFNKNLQPYGGGATRVRGMIAQIVYTVTALPKIDKVWIWMEGKKNIILGGEGLILDHPLTRSETGY